MIRVLWGFSLLPFFSSEQTAISSTGIFKIPFLPYFGHLQNKCRIIYNKEKGDIPMNIAPNDLSLLTDLYQLTMAATYYENKMFAPATFSLFIRKYPPDRGYFISAGLEDTLEFLESFHFEQENLGYLKKTGMFSDDFLHYLSKLQFNGDVYAMLEGQIFFKDEPVLEVTGPIIEAQLVETFIINAMNLPIVIAGKAARCVLGARGRKLIDFSLRRTQGIDAGMKVARSSYMAGFDGTSNVLAGERFDIPISGTMAHSYVTSFEEEIDSFRAFAEVFPANAVLLIDTFDTINGAYKAVEVAKEMSKKGKKIRGVRLDSGDMTQLSKDVRQIFRDAGMADIYIFASGGYDEYKIGDAVESNAEIDGFGVGTKMGVSADAPYLDIAYKLVQYDERPLLKLSSGKKTLVNKKQVFRKTENQKPIGDVIALRNEKLEGKPLLMEVMRKGQRLAEPESLQDIRQRLRNELNYLDDDYKRLKDPEEYPVELSAELQKLQKEVVQELTEKELG
jgi:nicotinate phosphoribosyltransferase